MTIDISEDERNALSELLLSACNTLDTMIADKPTDELMAKSVALESLYEKVRKPDEAE